MKLEVEISGGWVVAKRLLKYRDKIGKQVVPRALDTAAIELLESSIGVAPVLTGDLIRSARIVKQRGKGWTRRLVTYGTAYAEYQHAGIGPTGRLKPGPITSQKPSTEDGKAGSAYLSRPFERLSPRIIKYVRREWQKANAKSFGLSK